MIDPRSVLIATPAHDGRVETTREGTMLALGAAGMVGNVVYLNGCSDIALARNLLANGFLHQSKFDWLVFIDSDIGFSVDDFRRLMDYPAVDDQGVASDPDDPALIAQAAEVTVNTFGEALVVCAEYARKVPKASTVTFGLGFTRIHRGVLERLEAAKDDEGAPRIGQFTHKGELYSHFFPAGPAFHGQWLGEDLGFFHLCRLIGITPRIERRTQLLHVGRAVWRYPAVDHGATA